MQMHSTKAPRTNGMPPVFFQKYWHIRGPFIIEAMLQALNSYQIPNDLNLTFITLILKKKQPVQVPDYLSISHCNVLYNLISKVIANILKLILLNLISDSQTNFVPRKQVIGNVLIAYKLIHFLRRKIKGKQAYMSIKLDMNKAYNRVEQDYLEKVLTTMGFHLKMVNLIMQCMCKVCLILSAG